MVILVTECSCVGGLCMTVQLYVVEYWGVWWRILAMSSFFE